MIERARMVSEAERFVRLRELLDRTGLSSRTIYRKMAAGQFPRSVQLGTNTVGWRESEVDAWIQAPMEWRAAA